MQNTQFIIAKIFSPFHVSIWRMRPRNVMSRILLVYLRTYSCLAISQFSVSTDLYESCAIATIARNWDR